MHNPVKGTLPCPLDPVNSHSLTFRVQDSGVYTASPGPRELPGRQRNVVSTRVKVAGPQALPILAIRSSLAFFQFGALVGQDRLYERVCVLS